MALTSILAWVIPASGSARPAKESDVLTYVVAESIDSGLYGVDPGASETGSVHCPDSNSKLTDEVAVAGGGYLMSGSVGDSLASATASYPTYTLDNKQQGWHVVVSNPKLADGRVQSESARPASSSSTALAARKAAAATLDLLESMYPHRAESAC